MPAGRDADTQSESKVQANPQVELNAQAAGKNLPATNADNPGKSPGGGTAPDAIIALKEDHRRVETLFKEYEQATAGRKARIVKQICQELLIHTALEEELFYPACRDAAADEDPLDEAQVEHDSAKMLVADLMRGGRADRYRDAKVSVLAEQIRHHVAEEEKPAEGIFAKAQESGANTPELAQRLQVRKQNLQAKLDELPAPQPVSFQISLPAQAPKEEQMARGDNNRDDRGRFTGDDDRGRRGGGRSNRDDDDRTYRSRSRDDEDDGRGWYGDPRGHSEAARRGWAERSGEPRAFSRGRDDDDDDRGGRGGDRDRDERGRFMSDDDDRGYRSRGRDEDDRRGGRGGGDRDDRDDRGRFTNDEDRSYRSRGRDDDDDRRGARGDDRDRDDRGRFTSDDDDRRYRSRGRDDDDDRGARGRGGRSQGGWFGDSEGHSEAARRGWEDREGGARGRSRDDDDHRNRDSARGRGQGGWFGDSRGHAEAARRGWEDRR